MTDGSKSASSRADVIDAGVVDSLVKTGIPVPEIEDDDILYVAGQHDRTLNDDALDSLAAEVKGAFARPARVVLEAGETPEAWTFKCDAVAEKFEDHVREQLPWYDVLSRYVCDLAISFLPRGGVLYDIGASTGNITSLLEADLLSKEAVAVSIEPSHQMSHRWGGNGALWTIEAENIDFMRQRPDVAIMFLTIMFMKPSEREDFLDKLFEAVTPGGAVIIVDKGYLHHGPVQVACKAAQLAGKRRAGTPGDAYVTKELSLRGEQRPTDDQAILELAVEHGFVGEPIFRFGEFYGILLVKRAV